MKSKVLSVYFVFVALLSFGQNEIPYAYNNAIITNNQPSSVKEYAYDYDTQVPELVKNHTLKYNSNGLLTEHVESNEGISDFYQTFRYRFQYDSKSRLTYYWNEQLIGSNYKSQNEQQWIYDSHDMITEVNEWSVVNDNKQLGGDSYKRVITRDANNQVLKIEKSIYTYSFDVSDYVFVLDKVYTFKYDANNNLDSIIVFARNITLGGVMKLESKQYKFNFKNYDVVNTDLLLYNSYKTSNYNDEESSIVNLYDSQGRLISIETAQNGVVSNQITWEYKADKITEEDRFGYERDIDYIDASGRTWKNETYSYNPDTYAWELDDPAYSMNVRTFASGKLTSDLFKNYYDAGTQTYKNETRYDYTYSSLPTGIVANKTSDIVLLYPNPSAGIVHVNGLQNIQKLSIASLNGTTISLPLQEQIDLSGFAAGVYIINAEFTDASSSIQRLILK